MTTSKIKTIVLGGGCFWCLDAVYHQIAGVTSVISGFAGGHDPQPTYDAVCTGETGHAEVVQVEFDSAIIALADILDIFWTIHNPTTLNMQGYDRGTEYRSIILYAETNQLDIIQSSITQTQELWPDPIVTEVAKLEQFYPAEDYHQDFFAKHPELGYCQIIINPKLQKLREKFASRLK